MITPDQITDHYSGGRWVRRWCICEAGQPRCLEDAVPADHPDAAAVLARNAAVRADIQAVTAYEAAERLAAQVAAGDEPPKMLPETGQDGEAFETPNPAWQAWRDALATLQTATGRTRALALVRRYGATPPPAEMPDGTINPERDAYDAARAMLMEE